MKDKFPIGSNVKVVNIYPDEFIYRGHDKEPGEELSKEEKKNLRRLEGAIGTVIEHQYIDGFESHWVARVNFYNDEDWCFSPSELELTTEQLVKTPAPYVEKVDYKELTEKEVALAEKVLLTALGSFEPDRVGLLLGNSAELQEFVGESILVAREFTKQSKLLWETGTKLVQTKEW